MNIKKRIEEVVQNGTLQSGEEITYIETDELYAILDDIANSSNDIKNVSYRKWLVGFIKDGIHYSEIATAPTATIAKSIVNHNNPKMLKIVRCIEQI